MKRLSTFTFAVVVCCTFALGGCDDTSENGGPAIVERWDAWVTWTELFSSINSQVVTSRSSDKSWSDEVVDGAQGTLTINGSYEFDEFSTATTFAEYDYAFNNVTLDFDDYTSDSDDDALRFTGSLLLDGTVHEETGSTSSSYSGGWTLNGDLDLAGFYGDEISLSVTFREDSMMRDYSGTLTTSSGDSYSVTPDR